ncbi:TPA: hypothetical protein CPT87_11270 [Candidatus Gastranaerophilales bacterium HUM_5]|nr:MAG TPA: hypothetical protein CPT99_09065 [Candidatus Gastranaerophilales bacterium HUM_4]DAA88231.1 MAG TPA: hypothetical protein CPT87_11270 [Candidatus Gastranaerophilales bacterium HUM_5]
MRKKLKTNGNSWSMYIHKEFSEILGISETNRHVVLVLKKQTLYLQSLAENYKNSQVNFLTKKLIKRGSGYGLIFTLPILELLQINPEIDWIDIEVNKKTIKIKKHL